MCAVATLSLLQVGPYWWRALPCETDRQFLFVKGTAVHIAMVLHRDKLLSSIWARTSQGLDATGSFGPRARLLLPRQFP